MGADATKELWEDRGSLIIEKAGLLCELMTIGEMCLATGHTAGWLRTRQCAWCKCPVVEALRWDCQSDDIGYNDGEDCDPLKQLKRHHSKPDD